MRTIYVLCVLSLAFSGQALAQLKCTNCRVTPSGGAATSANDTPVDIVATSGGGTFTGDIVLTGNSAFSITGTGHYIIDGVIQSGTENYGLTLTASSAGGWGGQDAGLLLKGSAANTYKGPTIINSGYIACKKDNAVVAIPGDITIKTSPGNAESGLWFGADGQLSGSAVLSFETNSKNAIVSLNGTTQSLRGVNISGANSILENIETSLVNIPNIDRNTTAKATLILTGNGTGGRYIIGGSATFRAGGGGGGLEVQVQGTSQVIQNLSATISNVTFISASGSTLEFNTTDTGSYSMGGGITFKGNGTLKKTGPGVLAMTNASILKSGGDIWVAEGTLRNDGTNVYSNSTESNSATLRVEAATAGSTPIFDLWGNNSVFGGLAGNGIVQNNFGSAGTSPGGGYNELSLKLTGPYTFAGVIRDNSGNNVAPQSNGGEGKGGVALKSDGFQMQYLSGVNLYTGSTTVLVGTLQLTGEGKLGGGTYTGVLNVGGYFQHSGSATQVFAGDITNGGSLLLNSGKTIITGNKSFTGSIAVYGGFLGGTGNLNQMHTLDLWGSICAGDGVEGNGVTFAVNFLNIRSSTSKLIVTSKPDHTPSALNVAAMQTKNGNADKFIVDVLGGADLQSGRIIMASINYSNAFSIPILGVNNTGKPVTFRWVEGNVNDGNNGGLYMDISTKGLSCDNCSFPGPANTTTVGTPATPAFLLSGDSGEFTGDITLNGDCNFSILGAANYTLSGQIKSADGATTSLTFKAPAAGTQGKDAGITLSGAAANTYSGLTTIASGYVICNKTNAVAIPNNLKISAISQSSFVHLWCKANGQLGNAAVVDFSDAQTNSFLHLNGTTQTIAGLKSNNGRAVVENWQPDFLPASMANEQPAGGAILNIAAAADNNSCIFGGGGVIFKGRTTQSLTVNVTGGTQIIQNPTTDITNVTLTSAGGGTLEFNTDTAVATYSLGSSVILKGDGTLKKTGPGVLVMTGTSVLKPGGQIWVAEGTLRNDGTNVYSNSTESNSATLRVEAATATAGSTPIFDLWGNNSVFGGLTGSGVVQNNFGTAGTSPGGGYNELFLKLTSSYTFNGVIRDNSGSYVSPVSGGGEGKGGIALKIEGSSRTQSLSGVNRYTGSTTVSAGTLKLQGAGQLSGWLYSGTLEIANVADAASQAIFEHNGTESLGFSGDITNTGAGTVKGIFLQSGSGKSIIMGSTTKAFTGNVNITGGFLGGGNLGNVNTVNLDATGSIGGGLGTEDTGGKLTSKGLTFKSETAKLTVMSTSNRTLSLVDVLSRPIAAANVTKFVVDVLGGANLQSGLILKTPNASPAGLPTPVIGVNNTGKGVRLYWDNDGLQMQISHGTIALSTGSVCPRGTAAAGNSPITVTATYSDALDFPPTTVTPDFTLSDSRAKSGDIVISRDANARTITATFDGANPTNADLPYIITYDDHQYAVKSETRINRPPTLSVTSGGNPACVGTPLVLQGVAKGGTISSQNTNIATVGNTTENLSATATTRAAGDVNFLMTDGDGCKSEYLPVVVKGTPVITPGSTAICANGSSGGNTTTLTADQDPASPSAWAINPADQGASVEDGTLPTDRLATFHVTSTTIIEQKQFTVEYTNNLGCKGTTIITVKPSPVITPAFSSICATDNGVGNTTNLTANRDPASASVWAINPADQGASVEDGTTGDKLAVFRVAGTPIITAQKRFTVEYTDNTSCKGTIIITVNPVPVITVSPATATICTGEQTAISLSTNVSEAERSHVTYSWAVTSNTVGAQASTANQASFEQQRLLNSGTAESRVTYTFTSRYTTADGAVYCTSQPGTSIYTVGPHFEVGISNITPEKVCLGDNKITLTATTVPEGTTYQWLKDGSPVDGATGNSFDVLTNKVSASSYAVKITNRSSCAVSEARKVEVTEDAYFINGKAEIFISQSAVTALTEVEVNKPVSFKYSGPDAGYSWNFGDNTPVVTDKETSHSYSNQGTYKPTLGVVKPNQADCKKTFTLPDLKITPVTGDPNGSGAFSVYPVPAQDRLTIVNDGSDLQNITIRDISGKTVMSEAVHGRKVTLSIAHLTNGIYLLTVTDSKGVKHMEISKN